MVLTREYNRYEIAGVCNIIASASTSLQLVNTKVFAAAACEDVLVRDIRTGAKICTLVGEKFPVTALRLSPNKQTAAVGYADGTIKLFDLKSPDSARIVLAGHKSAVNCLAFDSDGLRLLSGGKDATLILWDLVGECGLFKLKGHRGPISQCQFICNGKLAVSSSKDTFIKFWDLSSQHCFYTIAGHRTEVWDFVFVNNDRYLLTGATESEMKLYEICYLDSIDKDMMSGDAGSDVKKSEIEEVDGDTLPQGEDLTENQANTILRCRKIGTFLRTAKGRVQQLSLSSDERLLAIVATSPFIEFYLIYSEDEVRRRQLKKIKKARKKAAKLAEENSGLPSGTVKVETVEDEATPLRFEEAFQRLGDQKMTSKVSSIAISFISDKDGQLNYKICYLLNNNSIEQHDMLINSNNAKIESTKLAAGLTLQGHRTDVRCVAVSNDNTAFLSGSQDSIKIWNRSSLECIRTFACADYAVSALFVPGDRHCVVGTKSGSLLLYDISASELVSTIDAHSGAAVWSLFLAPDQKSFVSGGADKDVKFWNFELQSDGEKSRLVLQHKRTLTEADDVMAVCVSPNQKFIAAALLDNTTKVFFYDSLKFFLSLYGHSLPVLCIDISHDSKLLVSGSADKNVKIWGLDFGDCHKSLFAHDDSVTCVKFVPKTHTFFSSGKDGRIKQWDADKFNRIQVLDGHHGEIWAMALASTRGNFLISAAHDKTIRLWERTEEPLVLQEEEEREREEQYDKTLVEEEDVIPGEVETETGLAGKKTVETVKSTESILEALEICEEEKAAAMEEPKPSRTPHPLIKAYGSPTLSRFMADVILKIRSSELEKSLIMLPFAKALELFPYLGECIEKWYEVEVCTRCVLFLLRIHHQQLVNSDRSVPIVDHLRGLVQPRITEYRSMIGYNLAALRFLQLELAERQEVKLFADASAKFQERKKRKKQKELVDKYALADV